MEADAFTKLLRGLSHRKPFRPFSVEFGNGESVVVDHQEAMVVGGGVAVFLDATGVPSWFDHLSVTRVVDASGAPPMDASSKSA